MDTHALARRFGADLVAHRNKLAGKADDAVAAQFALHQAAERIGDQHGEHRKATETVLSHWDGAGSEQFARRARRLGRQLRVTETTSREAEKVVAGVTAALSGGHTTARRIVDEYTTRASRVLDAGLAVSGAGAQAALMRAVATVADLVAQYTKESVANLRRVNGELTEAARKLRALERGIEDDGRPAHPERDKRDERDEHGKGIGRTVVAAARRELGTTEKPPGSNRNPYGPTAPWCSSFATAMWRKAGVSIPVLPFTGDVYRWGQRHGKAYGRDELSQARPGDVLLFGTGPGSPRTSTHIGIVEKVEGGKVTLIEGNSGDGVRRNTHSLSSSTFYGGVHP